MPPPFRQTAASRCYQRFMFFSCFSRYTCSSSSAAQFISEAVDQTRGWFYSLLAISTLLFDKAPYENVLVLGLVQDENGQKMSKSKGNAVDPFDALQTYGADAIRWYFYSSSAPWLPSRFAGKTVVEGQRKFMGTLWNTYAFFVLYANIDQFDATKYTLDYDKLSVMDKWLLSRLESTIQAVDSNLENYRLCPVRILLPDLISFIDRQISPLLFRITIGRTYSLIVQSFKDQISFAVRGIRLSCVTVRSEKELRSTRRLLQRMSK